MKKLLILTGLTLALAVMAAPEQTVTKSASGSTSASVLFEPGPREATLVAADVTSDKAASVLSWRVGVQQVTLLKPAANNVTNLTTTVATLTTGSNLLSVTAAGTVTAHTVHASSLTTNKAVTFTNPLGTNLAVGDTLRELSTSYAVVTQGSTNSCTIATNGWPVTAGTLYAINGNPSQLITSGLASFTTNGAVLTLTFSNNFGFLPLTVQKLTTNIYTVAFAAADADSGAVIDGTNGLAPADSVVLIPATGGAVRRELVTFENHVSTALAITAVTGLALATGDQIFQLSSAVTTPVGATTLRLYAPTVRVLPKGVPGVLSVDGTSACAVNAAIVKY